MKINILEKGEFLEYVYSQEEDFMQKLKKPEAFIIKSFYSKETIVKLRNTCFEHGMNTESSWHPLNDECPDYHRLHDNYPKAHVKQKFHAFYHHGYLSHNEEVFSQFDEVFKLKTFLAENQYQLHNKPSERVVARVNVHHYPKGGGYQMEHIDPAQDFARIQTLICASEFGKDFSSGGVYARAEKNGKKYFLDKHLDIGDLLIISPDIQHGVHPIDEELDYSWQTNDGRWMILPIFVMSDYNWESNIKPKEA